MTPFRDDWDTHWRDNAAAAAENPAQVYRHGLVINRLEKAAGKKVEARLIDFGSGQGDFLSKAAQAFPDMALAGFELSEEGVRIAASKVARARFLQVDLFKPSTESAEFQGWATHAVCSEVLEHLDDPARFLRAADRYLAPGAWMIITVPGGPMSAFDRRIGHRRHFTPGELRGVIEENGFDCREVCRAGFPFHNLYRLAVIARGARLAEDAREMGGKGGGLARLAMRAFGVLFHANFPASPFGWQLIALAQKKAKG